MDCYFDPTYFSPAYFAECSPDGSAINLGGGFFPDVRAQAAELERRRIAAALAIVLEEDALQLLEVI